jgi:hypothetical protein
VTSPTADLPTLAAHVANTPGYGAFAALLAQGAHISDPRIRPDRLLTPSAFSRLGITAIGCLGVAFAAYGDLTGSQLVSPAYATDPAFVRYLRTNSTGHLPLGGPVLLLQGDADTVVPVSVTDQVAASLCRLGTHLEYRTYPGLEHDTYPWVQGIDWQTPNNHGMAGHLARNGTQCNFGGLKLTLYTRWSPSPAMVLHIRLLGRLDELPDATRALPLRLRRRARGRVRDTGRTPRPGGEERNAGPTALARAGSCRRAAGRVRSGVGPTARSDWVAALSCTRRMFSATLRLRSTILPRSKLGFSTDRP